MQRTSAPRYVQIIAIFAIVLAACGGATDESSASPPTGDTVDSMVVSDTEPASAVDDQVVPDSTRIDYLTFAEGAVPISVGGAGADLGADVTSLVQWVDGDPTPRSFVTTEDHEAITEFVYGLPSLTTFDRFAVPEIGEVPSAYTTFTRNVEVLGSASGPDSGFEVLATGTLETHEQRGEVTELTIVATLPVRWIRLRLQGGIENLEDQMTFEFSEIIGNGTQEPRPVVDHFSGLWFERGGHGARIELTQEGSLVTGCYDNRNELQGTVTGNILRAQGENDAGIPSVFILSVLEDGRLRGLRSTNGSPFSLYTGPGVEEVPDLACGDPPHPVLGCGSVIHGINFGYDSASILPASEPILQELFDGVSAETSSTVAIEGHTSSEGSDEYNQGLSERRAQSVVDDLVNRGIAVGRLSAVGKGEAEPIAPNSDENGRSMNRRVEIVCS